MTRRSKESKRSRIGGFDEASRCGASWPTAVRSSLSGRPPGGRVLTLALALLAGCISTDAPSHPRPALPLPDEIRDRYALGGPVREEFLVPLNLEARIYRGRLSCGKEHPEFELILPEKTPAPFLLCLPILAGGRELMEYVAHTMAKKGYAVAWGRRVASALKPHQSVADVESLFRRSVIHNRAVLAWARRQPWCRAGEDSLLGISTGGILGGTLLAVEPELAAGVLILAGGDLPDLLQHSSEGRIVSWRQHRQLEDELPTDRWMQALREGLHSDPARTAPYVPTEKVFLVNAALDTVVPDRNARLLWEGFGRPERLCLTVLSHYTALLGLHPALDAADRFLTRRIDTIRPR